MIFAAIRRFLGVELIAISGTEALIAAAGGGLSILALACITGLFVPREEATSIVASMGASAVLLFAVPHGQLSQPWPMLAGNLISAAIGVACARYIPERHCAAALAVGLSIAAMTQLKCIHPPGGATALTAVIGGSAIRELGFSFVSHIVLANAAVMLLLAVAINNLLSWRRYPSSLNPHASPRASAGPTPSHAEVLKALRSMDAFVDINEEDLQELVEKLTGSQRPGGRV